jgi:hypothetical protein
MVVRTGWPPLAIFVSVHSKRVKVVCFDRVLQVFILRGLAMTLLSQMPASEGGRYKTNQKPVLLLDFIGS